MAYETENKIAADTVIVLSSELISQVMEIYFNKTMFKLPVKIVDLQATETGYAFNVAFLEKKQQKEEFFVEKFQNNGVVEVETAKKRDKSGKFTKTTQPTS